MSKKKMGENPLGKTSKEGLNWLTESTKKSETISSPKELENRKTGKPENQKAELLVRHEFKASVSLTERLMKFKLHQQQKKTDILIQALDEFLTQRGY